MTSEATQNLPSICYNTTTVFSRLSDVPGASWDTGMAGAGGGPVAGMATQQPDLTGDPKGWTLLDQSNPDGDGDTRTPQLTQYIGGSGIGIGDEGFTGTTILTYVLNTGDGDGDSLGECTLADLATGWETVVPP
jgi:hypothetical protein